PCPAGTTWPAPGTSTTSSSTSSTPWSTRACSRPTTATATASAPAASRSPDSERRRQQPLQEHPDHPGLHHHREQHAVAGAPEMGAVVDVVAALAVHPDRVADVEDRVHDRRHRDEEHEDQR